MNKYISVLMVGIALISACSSTKEAVESKPKEFIPVIKKETLTKDFNEGLRTLRTEGEIEFNMPGLNNSADFELKIAGRDSLAMTIYGPMGITVAKLYATATKFQFLNSFSGELYEGTPSEENFSKIANIPLCFEDFISLLSMRLVRNKSEYTLEKSNKDSYQYVYIGKNYRDEVYIAADYSAIFGIWRYGRDNTKLYEAKYENNFQQSGINISKRIILKFPTINGSINIEYDKVEANVTFDKPFAFKIPKSVERTNLD